MKSDIYVLIFNPTSPLEIWGPFASQEQASAFGTNWQNNHEDNPCWQLIEQPSITFYPAA